MDKESIFELQKIDCNCNNCGHFERDIEKTKKMNNNPLIIRNKQHHGFCNKLKKDVCEIANICLLHTQDCFTHRKEMKS